MTDYADAPPVDRELLAFAVGVAHRAGLAARERFFAGTAHPTTKADGTEVTDADVAVEEQIRGELGRRAPDDEIYGEEAGTTAGTSGRRWVIDPIDGTYYFVRRIPLFGTLLAFEDEHGPAIGVVNQPVAEEMIFAARGLGCWRLTGPDADVSAAHRAGVSGRARLGGARTTVGNPGTWPEELLVALHRRVFLVGGADFIGVMTGRLDAFVIAGGPMGYEDVAPLPVIMREAGGRVSDLGGDPVLTGDGTVLATNGVLHEEFLALVAGLPRARDRRAPDAP